VGKELKVYLNRYKKNLEKNKYRIEKFLYNSFVYLFPIKDVVDSSVNRFWWDWWRIGRIDHNGEVVVDVDSGTLEKIADGLEALGHYLPADLSRIGGARKIIKELFIKSADPDIELFTAV